MNQDNNRQFIAKTELLVKPQDVTAISFLGDFNRLLPVKTQEKIMQKGSETIPYMGFIVDPYCFFLAYQITNTSAAQALLPEGYDLIDTSIFAGQTAVPQVIIGSFSVRTSAFIGNRIEFYIIARKRDTGLVSWIIADFETNTNNYEPKNGFGGYTADPAMVTTTPYGELLVDFASKTRQHSFALRADLSQGKWRDLNQELWVEGNLSIDYGGDLSVANSSPFGLIFDPYLMARAQELPLDAVKIQSNTYLSGLFDATQPLCAAVFPFSQHFIIKQNLAANTIKNANDLENQGADFLQHSGYKTMSGDAIKKPLLRSMVASAIITYGLITFLLLKLLL